MEQKQETREETERRKQEYRDLIDEVQDIRETNALGTQTVEKIISGLSKADQLIKTVKNADVVVLDAKVLNISSTVLRNNAEAIERNLVAFRPEEFCEKMLTFLTADAPLDQNHVREDDWRKVEPLLSGVLQPSPSFTFMSGTFEVEAPVAVKRQRKPKEKEKEPSQAKKDKPENVRSAKKEETGVEETVEDILQELTTAYRKNNNKPINFLKFIADPSSFGQTCENLFHVSFLVKDGHAKVGVKDGQPLIEPMMKNKEKTQQRQEKENRNQIVVQLTWQQWERIIEVYKIQEPMIPPKSSSQRRSQVSQRK